MQSEKQHIVLTESFFISIAVEKGEDFESLFSFLFPLHFPRSRLKYPTFLI